MRPILLLSCFWSCAIVLTAQGDDAPAGTPAVQLAIELSDGSRIIGTPSIDKLKIATKYADLEVQLSRVHTVEFGSAADRTAKVSLQNGDQLSGELAATEIAMKTIFGKVMVPMAEVSRIRTLRGGIARDLPEGLVLHYTFEKDEGEKVTDASSAGNDGKVQGAAFVKDGKTDGALSLTGDNQAVMVSNAANLQLQDFTIMAWVKRGSMEKTSSNWVDGVFFTAGQGGYGYGMHNDGTFFLTKIGVDAVFSSCRVNDKDFHHVVVTKNGSKVVFYLDGIACPANEYNSTFEFNTGFAVGARPDSMNCGFLGLIDELAVFNRALSEDEVKGVYDSQK